jgi:hypothetical protein
MTFHCLTPVAVALSIFGLSVLFLLFKNYSSTTTYEAPMEQTENNIEDAFPGRYLVSLCPGHSMEQHSSATGYDIKAYTYMLLDHSIYPDRIV